jgi:hypothetical protein
MQLTLFTAELEKQLFISLATPTYAGFSSSWAVSAARHTSVVLCVGDVAVAAFASAVHCCRYCCKACQGEHWRWHKALCRASSRPAAGQQQQQQQQQQEQWQPVAEEV